MVVLALDVSTTSTGLAIIDHDTKKTKLHNFGATGEVRSRIVKLAKEIKEYVKDIKFDVLVISKASYAQMNPNILMLEGIMLGLAIERDVPFDYHGDSSWWAFLGDPKTERPDKKRESIKFVIKQLGLENEVAEYKEKWSGKKSRTFEKISAILKNGKVITDDMSDAWCAGWFYPKKNQKKDLEFEKSETQTTINKLRKEATKLRNSIKTLELKNRALESEKKGYMDLYNTTQNLTYKKSYENRKKDILKNEIFVSEKTNKIEMIKKEVDSLMKKKHGIEAKKLNL